MKNERVYQCFEIARELGGTGRVQWREGKRGGVNGTCTCTPASGIVSFLSSTDTHDRSYIKERNLKIPFLKKKNKRIDFLSLYSPVCKVRDQVEC